MTYSDSIGDNAHLLRRTLLGTTDFAGRSRRTEVIYYWVASALVGVVVSVALMATWPFETKSWVYVPLRILLAIPMFALFVRRLHDQNRSGWWGVLLPVGLVLSISQELNKVGEFGAVVTQKVPLTVLALDLVSIAILVMMVWPGTAGPNQFGPDPRLGEH